MSAKALEKQRKASGREGKTYTTCIAFMVRILEDAARTQKSKVETNLTGRGHRAQRFHGENIEGWQRLVPTCPNRRPKPGDIYVLADKKTGTQFRI